jgi:hypothetical protein
LSRLTAWSVHAAALLVAASGLLWGWLRYFTTPDDPFAVVNHPLEPDLQALHVITAPLLVFAVAFIWRNHVHERLVAGQLTRRRSGLLLAILFPPMVASGYLLQVGVESGWRLAWAWVHGIAATVWIAVYVGHQFGGRTQVYRDSASSGSARTRTLPTRVSLPAVNVTPYSPGAAVASSSFGPKNRPPGASPA